MLYLRLGAVTVTQYVCCADIAAGRVDFDVTNTCLAANRDSGTASPAGHSPAEQTKADAASGLGSALVGSPRSPLAGMAQGPHPGQARDGHRLASKRIPALLEMEEPPGTDGTTAGLEGNPRPDPRHEHRQRALGRTEAARGTTEARNRGIAGNGCQVHGEAPQAAIAAVADVPGEPGKAVGIGGLLRGADREFPNPVCVPRSGA